MIDTKKNKWDVMINLNSEIEKEEDEDSKIQDEKCSTKQDNLDSQKRIIFQEVVSSNLSNIYQNICQEPSNFNTQNKTSFEEVIEKKSQQLVADNGNYLLAVDSNLQSNHFERSPFRKPSLASTSNLKSERVKTPRRQKFDEKQNNSGEPTTQKHVRIKSENIIKYFPQQDKQSTQPQQRNPQSSFQNAQKLLTELSRQFQYIGDFSLIRKEVIQQAISKNFTIMQNTNEFVTIKISSKIDYCQCLFNSCFNMQESGGIYQLKNSIYKRNKAKFILISGNEKNFLKFFRSILIKLWNQKNLKLKNKQLIEFFVNAQKEDQTMKDLRKQYTKLYNDLTGLNGESKSSQLPSQSLLSSLSENFKRLRSPQKSKSSGSEDRLKQLLEYNEKINRKFSELRNKLSFLVDSSTLDIKTLQKELQTEIYFHEFPVWKLFGFFYRKDYQSYGLRKQQILKQYSVRKIFSFLEIEEQYGLFIVQKTRMAVQSQSSSGHQMIKSCQNIQKNQNDCNRVPQSVLTPNIPYQECIKLLEYIGSYFLIPSKFMQKLQQFYNQLKTSYTQLYASKPVVKFSSMDDELPVTIFILLMMDFKNYRSVALNIVGNIKWIMRWIEHQQNSSDVEFDKTQPNVQARQGFTLQKKVLTTLEAAIQFVIKQWKDHEKCNKTQKST